MLSVDQLDGLAARWRRIGAPIAGRLRPGLDAADLDAVGAAVGLRLAGELRTWWGWHDGAQIGELARDSWIGPDTPFLSAAESLAERARLADHAARFGWSWSESWLPVTRLTYGAVIVDCAVGDDAPSPVRLPAWDEPDDEERTRVLLGSLGELVEWWSDAIDSGGWSFEPEAGFWLHDEERLEPRRAITGLV